MTNYRLHNIRAFAILTVVLGHSIILYSSVWNLYITPYASPFLDTLKSLINLYQMPLFFSLSGSLFAKSLRKKPSPSAFIIKKTKRLLIPFLLIGFLFMIPLKLALGYPGYAQLTYPQICINLLRNIESGHLWYLPTLFYLFILFLPIYHHNRPSVWGLLTVLLVALQLNSALLPSLPLPYFNYVFSYAWCFALGALLENLNILRLTPSLAVRLALLGFVLAFCLVDVLCHLQLDLLCAILLILIVYTIAPEHSHPLANKISRNSFGLYLFHSPLVYITFTYFSAAPIWFVVALNLCWGIFAYGMTVAMRKIHCQFVLGE